jgi:hypothetical protein
VIDHLGLVLGMGFGCRLSWRTSSGTSSDFYCAVVMPARDLGGGHRRRLKIVQRVTRIFKHFYQFLTALCTVLIRAANDFRERNQLSVSPQCYVREITPICL